MKIKNKGKVHPSPSSSSSSSSSNDREMVVLSVLKLLPAAILALASVLSLDDREVLAYLITRSLKTPSSSSSSSSSSSPSSTKKKPSKKQPKTNNNNNSGVHNKARPMFDCGCFDCYTSYWVRWDSSPNRELIHHVIEAFEDHLTSGEKPSKPNKKKSRSDKLGRREAQQRPADVLPPLPEETTPTTTATTDDDRNGVVLESLPEVTEVNEKSGIQQNVVVAAAAAAAEEGEEEEEEEVEVEEGEDDDVAVVLRTMAASEHKGLARKVLPDVLGLLNSRLWSLWSPNA